MNEESLSEYERGYSDGLKDASAASQPSRLLQKVALERETRESLEIKLTQMLHDPSSITENEIRFFAQPEDYLNKLRSGLKNISANIAQLLETIDDMDVYPNYDNGLYNMVVEHWSTHHQ